MVAERDVGHLLEDAVERQAHRVVARVHHLVGAARVRELDDGLRVVARRERGGGVVEVRPLQQQLHREVGPRFATVAGDELELGEVPADLVDEADVLRRERHPGSGHSRAHADRDVELDALRVDRIELRVVDRDLRIQARRERRRGLDAQLLDRAWQIADRVHAAVRVDLEAPEEAVGVLLQGPQRIGAAVLGERHAEHALLDAEAVHLLEQEPDRVVARLGVGHVLEHVLRRELELVERLAVAQALAQELVRPRPARKGVAIIRSITPMSVGMVMRASLERDSNVARRSGSVRSVRRRSRSGRRNRAIRAARPREWAR